MPYKKPKRECDGKAVHSLFMLTLRKHTERGSVMKKLAFLTVLFVLALALAGCNAENDEPQGDNGGI